MYPETMATYTWTIEDMTFSLVVQDQMGHYCGYVRFPELFMEETGYSGILNYVPVHGGITFACSDEQGMVYGFDCAHADDENNSKCKDMNWLEAETERMAWGILVAYRYEQSYLNAKTDTEKAEIINKYHQEMDSKGVEFDIRDNFGAMINLIFGQL